MLLYVDLAYEEAKRKVGGIFHRSFWSCWCIWRCTACGRSVGLCKCRWANRSEDGDGKLEKTAGMRLMKGHAAPGKRTYEVMPESTGDEANAVPAESSAAATDAVTTKPTPDASANAPGGDTQPSPERVG
jgi:hypothetical protein